MWPAFGWPPEAQAHLNDLYREAVAVIYGRRTCTEAVVQFWTGIAANGLPEGMRVGRDRPRVRADHGPAAEVRRLPRLRPGRARTQEVIGAPEVAGIVEAAGGPGPHARRRRAGGRASRVIDEIFLLVGPIVLGSGRLLLDVTEAVPTRLLTAWAIPPSCTVMRYAVADEFPAQR